MGVDFRQCSNCTECICECGDYRICSNEHWLCMDCIDESIELDEDGYYPESRCPVCYAEAYKNKLIEKGKQDPEWEEYIRLKDKFGGV